MNGKEIIDRGSSIIKRQDLDRTLFLTFVNSAQRFIINNNEIQKLSAYTRDIDVIDGIVDISNYTAIQSVDWELDEKILPLTNVLSLKNVINQLNIIGSPRYYTTIGSNLYVVPVPAEGTVNIYGEKYISDLEDNIGSTNLFSIEIPEVLIYLGTAEYFDMLSEESKGDYWRKKATGLLGTYITKCRRNLTNNMELMTRDPFGNLGLDLIPNDIIVDEYDGGVI